MVGALHVGLRDSLKTDCTSILTCAVAFYQRYIPNNFGPSLPKKWGQPKHGLALECNVGKNMDFLIMKKSFCALPVNVACIVSKVSHLCACRSSRPYKCTTTLIKQTLKTSLPYLYEHRSSSFLIYVLNKLLGGDQERSGECKQVTLIRNHQVPSSYV